MTNQQQDNSTSGGSGGSGGGGGIELVPLTDATENGFTVKLPRGWQNQAYSARPHGVHRPVVNSRSPDGGTFLFVGDPEIPDFSEPTPPLFPGFPLPGSGNPLAQVHPFVPAEPFFRDYVGRRFGRARGFRLLGVTPCPALEQDFHSGAAQRGMQVWPTAVSLSFEFADDAGRRVGGRVHGATVSFGAVWIASVFGVLNPGAEDPARWDALLFGISRSYQTNPQWRQTQDQAHAQAMNRIQNDHQSAMRQMQTTHQNNMQWIDQSGRNHQAHMDSLHAAGDAQMQGWQAQQAASDGTHRNFMDTVNAPANGFAASPGGGGGADDARQRRFLNYIKDENTITDPGGDTYQVEGHHERYFVNRNDDTYIATDAVTERGDLHRTHGVNPDHYEEGKIVR